MPTTGGAIIIIVAFLLPGFVTVLYQERTFKSAEDPTPLDRTLRIVWYSGLSYLLVAIVALLLSIAWSNVSHWQDIEHFFHRHDDDPAELIGIGAGLVVVPSLLIGEVTRRWAGSPKRQKVLEHKWLKINVRHTQPTAWDAFFRQRRESMVRVTFADGRRVLGYYGQKSFAAYAKDGQDLLLEKLYLPNDPVNEWFGAEVPVAQGVWIRTADAVWVEFYTPKDGGSVENGAPREDPQGDGTSGAQDDHVKPDATTAAVSTGKGWEVRACLSKIKKSFSRRSQ
jgi:hypothetical protein